MLWIFLQSVQVLNDSEASLSMQLFCYTLYLLLHNMLVLVKNVIAYYLYFIKDLSFNLIKFSSRLFFEG